MRCGLYTIIDPFKTDKSSGGGSQAAINVIDVFGICGVNVDVITPESQFVEPDKFDVCLYLDIFNDPLGSKWFTMAQYEPLLNTNTPFFVFENAYTCCTTEPYGWTNPEKANLAPFSKRFAIKARKFIFVSPLHKQTTERLLGVTLDHNSYEYFQFIDTELFKTNNKSGRPIKYLYVGAINYYKGIDILCQKYGKELTIAGYGDTNMINNGAQYLGHLKLQDLPQVYNLTQNYVFEPRWKETFSRTVCEAALCGCNILGNSNIGVLSYNRDITNPQTYKDGQEDFIRMLKNELKTI